MIKVDSPLHFCFSWACLLHYIKILRKARHDSLNITSFLVKSCLFLLDSTLDFRIFSLGFKLNKKTIKSKWNNCSWCSVSPNPWDLLKQKQKKGIVHFQFYCAFQNQGCILEGKDSSLWLLLLLWPKTETTRLPAGGRGNAAVVVGEKLECIPVNKEFRLFVRNSYYSNSDK